MPVLVHKLLAESADCCGIMCCV